MKAFKMNIDELKGIQEKMFMVKSKDGKLAVIASDKKDLKMNKKKIKSLLSKSKYPRERVVPRNKNFILFNLIKGYDESYNTTIHDLLEDEFFMVDKFSHGFQHNINSGVIVPVYRMPHTKFKTTRAIINNIKCVGELYVDVLDTIIYFDIKHAGLSIDEVYSIYSSKYNHTNLVYPISHKNIINFNLYFDKEFQDSKDISNILIDMININDKLHGSTESNLEPDTTTTIENGKEAENNA